MLTKLNVYAKLARIDHGILTALAVVAGAISSGIINPANIILAVFSAFLAEVFLFITNDILNIEEDRVNSPDRPLVKGEVTLGEAWAISMFALFTSLVLSYLIGLLTFFVMVTVLALGFFYNAGIKKTGFLGNVIVAAVTASSFLYGGIAATGYIREKILYYSLIAFTANIGRELLKGVRDVVGDMRTGIRSVAVVFGEKSAGALAAFFMITAVAMSLIGLRYSSMPTIYMSLISVTDVIFIYASAAMLLSPSSYMADKLRKTTLLGMGLAIVAFMF